MILITGHQRSGTGYMARLCQAMGMDVGHERVGRDGVSSFMFAVNTRKVCFHTAEQHRGRKHYRFDRVFHVVRHPLDVIASTALTDNRQMRKALRWQSGFVHVDIDASMVRQAVQTWIGWNELIDGERIRVEDADEVFPAMLGREIVCDLPPKDYNSRTHDRLTWSDIEAECVGDEFARLRNMAERYGYE